MRGQFNSRELFRLNRTTTLDDNNPAAERMHIWEAAGLGRAPYRVIGCVEHPNVCAFCGTNILINYRVEDARGYQFVVGSDCVRSSGDDGMILTVRYYERMARRERAAQRAAKMSDELRALIRDHADELRQRPHPNGFAGLTLLWYAEWMHLHAGATGKARAIGMIRAALK